MYIDDFWSLHPYPYNLLGVDKAPPSFGNMTTSDFYSANSRFKESEFTTDTPCPESHVDVDAVDYSMSAATDPDGLHPITKVVVKFFHNILQIGQRQGCFQSVENA